MKKLFLFLISLSFPVFIQASGFLSKSANNLLTESSTFSGSNTYSGDNTFSGSNSLTSTATFSGRTSFTSTVTFTGSTTISSKTFVIDGTNGSQTIGGHRVGAIEIDTATVNVLVQIDTITVTGSATVDFTDEGLKDYGGAPMVILVPEFNSDGNTELSCNPHTISATGMVIECTLNTGDGVAQTVAADAVARGVTFMLTGTAP